MMVSAIRCPVSNMHAIMRRFDCRACCCPSLMQVDRSLCMTGAMCVDDSSTTCVMRSENQRGNSQVLHVSVVVVRGRPMLIRTADGIPTERGCDDACACDGSVTAREIGCGNKSKGEITGATRAVSPC